MPALSTAQRTALATRSIMRRDFVLFSTAPPIGFWTDVGVVTINSQDYIGAGVRGNVSLTQISDLSIPSLSLTLSGVSADVANAVRGEDLAQVPVVLSMGIFDPQTQKIIGSLLQVFTGQIDKVKITTPEIGGESVIALTCESTSRALTRKSSDTRSNASQVLRSPTDIFYAYTSLQRKQVIYFGRKGVPTGGSSGKSGNG